LVTPEGPAEGSYGIREKTCKCKEVDWHQKIAKVKAHPQTDDALRVKENKGETSN
jgi:hypothetical protein